MEGGTYGGSWRRMTRAQRRYEGVKKERDGNKARRTRNRNCTSKKSGKGLLQNSKAKTKRRRIRRTERRKMS